MAAGEHAVVLSWGFVTISSKGFFRCFQCLFREGWVDVKIV